MTLSLPTPIQEVRGIGPSRARMLSREGIRTVGDLLRYKPFRYQDRTELCVIAGLVPGREAVVEVEVRAVGAYTTSGRVRIVEATVQDSSGRLPVKFFGQPYLRQAFRKGRKVILCGTPSQDDLGGETILLNPDYEFVAEGVGESLHAGRIVPVYRRIEGVTTRILRRIIHGLLKELHDIPDPLPLSVRKRHGLLGLQQTFWDLHFPQVKRGGPRGVLLDGLRTNRTEAHRRLIFEEFFLFQLGLQLARHQRGISTRRSVKVCLESLVELAASILPFKLTAAQSHAVREIAQDLSKPQGMNRLLQGDVGSGKTVVALLAALMVMKNGCQVALMAPTELLAEQHQRNISRFLGDTGFRSALLTGSLKGREKEAILKGLRGGVLSMVTGTHALIQEGVEFRDLALVIIDEQHRFGVSQRTRLTEKAVSPDLLVMSATPIPRSLALTLYGDLDVTVLDQMPPGRASVKTVLKFEKDRPEVYEEVRRVLESGRQAFVVYPAIEESRKLDLRAARKMEAHLRRSIFPEFKVGLMHGRLGNRERDELMRSFRAGQIHLLVSTTVIEVGIDIPNTSVLVIEQAERFGLSQLHQLRGRIARGQHPGLCILMTDAAASGHRRLEIMVETNNGFEISEKDLRLRGPASFLVPGSGEIRVSNLETWFGMVRSWNWLGASPNVF